MATIRKLTQASRLARVNARAPVPILVLRGGRAWSLAGRVRRFGVLRGMKEAQSCPGILVQGFWLQGFWALGLDPAWPGPGLAGAYFGHTQGVTKPTGGQSAGGDGAEHVSYGGWQMS